MFSLNICKAYMCFPWSNTQGASHVVKVCVCMRSMEYWGPAGGIHKWDVPSGLWVGFMMESVKGLLGSTSFWCPPRALVAVLPAPLHWPVMQHTYVFWWGEKEVGFFGSFLHSWGIFLLTHTLFSPWEKSWVERVFFGTELCHLRERVMMQVKWNLSSYPFQCIQCWVIFAPIVC